MGLEIKFSERVVWRSEVEIEDFCRMAARAKTKFDAEIMG
jgi:hypothetical protein